MQMATSLRAKAYLDRFFAELEVPFTTGSKTDIEASFMNAKKLRAESDLFAQYMDTQYAKSYQHYANIVKHTEETTKVLKVEELKEGPKEEVPVKAEAPVKVEAPVKEPA